MKTSKSLLDILEEKTFNHLEDKNYIYIPQNSDPKKNTPTIGNKALLALAGNMAFENYCLYRNNSRIKFDKNNNPPSTLLLVLKHHNLLFGKKPNEAELQVILKELELEHKRFEFVENLRNYLSHMIHDPGPIFKENLFKKYIDANNDDYKESLSYFEEKLELLKKSKIEVLERFEQNDEIKKDDKKINAIKIAKGVVNKLTLSSETNEITTEGALFIFSMYLRKSQINSILEKWNITKANKKYIPFDKEDKEDKEDKDNHKYISNKDNGYMQSVKSIFTNYAVKDSFSLTVQEPHLQTFREIVGHLTVFPHLQSPSLIPLYDHIKEQNMEMYKQMELNRDKYKNIKLEKEKLDKKIKNPKPHLKKTLEDNLKSLNFPKQFEEINAKFKAISDQVIPLRKQNSITKNLLKYLETNGFLSDFKIACKKQPKDFFEELKIGTIVELKDKVTLAKGDEKTEAKILYKSHKRNFKFVTAGQSDYNYAIKENNVILQYENTGNNPFKINILMGNELLLKLVCICMYGNNDHITNAQKQIKDFIIAYYNKLKFSNFNKLNSDDKFLEVIPKKKDKNWDADNQIKIKIDFLKKELNLLISENNKRDKPYKFDSKKKIDWIIKYNHFCFLLDKVEEGKKKGQSDEELDKTLRHIANNAEEAQIFYQILRFFRRQKLKEIDYNNYDAYFALKSEYTKYIKDFLEQNNTLEELFNAISHQFVKDLTSITITNDNREALITALKINKPASEKGRTEFLSNSAPHNLMLPPSIISLRVLFKEKFDKLIFEKSNQNDNHKDDDALMRNLFLDNENINTNTEFALQKLLPSLLKVVNDETEKKSLKKNVIKYFLKHKIMELAMWRIAIYFWHRNTSGYQHKWIIEANKDVESFKEFNSFYRVYDNPIQITWQNNFTFSISPRKMDDEFLYKESSRYNHDYIKKIIETHNSEVENDKKITDFVSMMAKLKTILNSSFYDISLILTAEKYWISNNKFTQLYKDKTKDKYKNKAELTNYYLDYNEIIKTQFSNIISENDKVLNFNFTFKDLISYRNNALHFQLQNPDKIEEIREFLKGEINKSNKILNFNQFTNNNEVKKEKKKN